MKLIGKPEHFTLLKPLRLRPFQRIGLGLETGTTLYLAPLPPRDGRVDEVIISTLKPDSWSQLVRITAHLTEKPGVVASVLAVLKQANINIDILETLTTTGHDTHELLAIVTLNKDNNAADLQSTLETKLLEAKAIKEREAVSVQSLRLLAVAKDRRDAVSNSFFIASDTTQAGISLSSDDWLKILAVGTKLPEPDDYTTVVMYSDTEEKYLSLFFPATPACLLRLTCKHYDKPGALHAFTTPLQDLGVNIVNSYSRLREAGVSAEWHATLDVTNSPSCANVLRAVQEQKEYYHSFIEIKLRYQKVAPRKEMLLPLFAHDVALNDMAGFYGRQQLVASISEEPRNTLLNGYSKSGKSSLLNKLDQQFSQAGALVVPVDADSDPMTFIPSVIYTIWSTLQQRHADLGSPPKEVSSFLPVGVYGAPGQVLANGPAMGHTRKYSRDVSSRITCALLALVSVAKTRGHTSIVVLVDEAQNVLYAHSDEGGADLRMLLMRLFEAVPASSVRWVFADGYYWRGARFDDNSTVLSKLHVVDMGPLERDEALKLVADSFDRVNVSVRSDSADSILEVTGQHPYSLQVVCKVLQQQLSRAPKVVDVLTKEMVDAAHGRFESDVHGFCTSMYNELHRLLGPDLKTLMEGEWKSETPQDGASVQSIGELRLQLQVLPGIIVQNGAIVPTPLFKRWFAGGRITTSKTS